MGSQSALSFCSSLSGVLRLSHLFSLRIHLALHSFLALGGIDGRWTSGIVSVRLTDHHVPYNCYTHQTALADHTDFH